MFFPILNIFVLLRGFNLELMNTLNILFIEDDIIELIKLKRTLKSLKLNHTIIEVNNGEEALTVLETSDNLPDIILMDLNMPKISGIEFLTILRAKKKFNQIPTIVLTTSKNSSDILKCYKLGISGYISKPLKYEDYVIKINNLFTYWNMNELIK